MLWPHLSGINAKTRAPCAWSLMVKLKLKLPKYPQTSSFQIPKHPHWIAKSPIYFPPPIHLSKIHNPKHRHHVEKI